MITWFHFDYCFLLQNIPEQKETPLYESFITSSQKGNTDMTIPQNPLTSDTYPRRWAVIHPDSNQLTIATFLNNFIWLYHILWGKKIKPHFENRFHDSYSLMITVMIIWSRSLNNCSIVTTFYVSSPSFQDQRFTVSIVKAQLLLNFPLPLIFSLFLSLSSAPCFYHGHFWHPPFPDSANVSKVQNFGYVGLSIPNKVHSYWAAFGSGTHHLL